MSQVEDSLRQFGTEPGYEIAQLECIAVYRNVTEPLYLDRVGTRPQLLKEPVAHAAVPLGVGHPRPVSNLRLDIAHRARTVELTLRRRTCPAAHDPGERREDRTSHRVCPAKRLMSRKIANTTCVNLLAVCRRSLST